MPPDAKLIRRLAQQERYQIGPLEKAYGLAAFLAEVAEDGFLRDRLVLKGGTALHLYHGRLQRVSVDADLNYMGPEAVEGLSGARRATGEAVERAARSQGYAPRTIKDAYALRSVLLTYATVNGATDAIKLDLNFLERILPPRDASPPAAFLLDARPIRCLDLTELAGSKMATALLRGAARDVFDVATLDWEAVDAPLARKTALFHGFLDHPALANFEPSRVDGLSVQAWDRDVRNLLRKGAEFRMEDVKRIAKARLGDLLPLQRDEQACQDRLLEGVWEPGLLFGSARVSPGLERHPGMMWRLRNPDARLPR